MGGSSTAGGSAIVSSVFLCGATSLTTGLLESLSTMFFSFLFFLLLACAAVFDEGVVVIEVFVAD